MTLIEWCQAERGRHTMLAQRTLICAEEITKIKAGKGASLRTALLIHKHTAGEVAIEPLLNERDRGLLQHYRGN